MSGGAPTPADDTPRGPADAGGAADVKGPGPIDVRARPLGRPRHHRVEVGSTNDLARELAAGGARHGTMVTAERQTAGRGRQGRAWAGQPGRTLALSLVLRGLDPPGLLPLIVAVAVAETAGPTARIKWPNDVVLPGADGRLGKLAGILCEGRPDEGWAVAGVGLNVALDVATLDPEVAVRAASMDRDPADLDAVRDELLGRLEQALALEPAVLLGRWSERDVLYGRRIRWTTGGADAGPGTADGVDAAGRLRVRVDVSDDGPATVVHLDAGEVHLGNTR